VSAPELPQLPFPQDHLLNIAPLYRTLREGPPVCKVRTMAGDEAWLVIRHPDVRRLLADTRLGRTHPDPANAPRFTKGGFLSGPSASGSSGERPWRARTVLAPSFAPKRMRALTDRIDAVLGDLLEALAARGGAADLHRDLSFPFPTLVICELLGVPWTDHEQFQRWCEDAFSLVDPAAAGAAMGQLVQYMQNLIERKRVVPADDVISDLVAAQRAFGLADGDIAGLAAGILFAGHGTTMSRIDFGVLFLLTHPEQLAQLRRDPSLLDGAVEEVLRMTVPNGGGGLPRYANADIDLHGHRINAGEAVLLENGAANRDPAVFDDAESFDIHRADNPHLAFGHGRNFCVGAALARIELKAVFGTLFDRFPTLRLSEPVDALRLRDDLLIGGLDSLPVRW
jgi:cytochrome P450